MHNNVKIVEVCTRDGFQSIREFIPTERKLEVVDRLIASGISDMQITSFVSPKAIPQMQDAAALAAVAIEKYPDVAFSALIPNMRGAETAVRIGIPEVSFVISLSETHNLRNVRLTWAQSREALGQILHEFPSLKVTVDVATAFGCPFEGVKQPEACVAFMRPLYDMGVRSFVLCDTIGVAYPTQVVKALQLSRSAFPDATLGLHIHDTRNMGVVCNYAGILFGVDSVETAAGGLGGCPFAPNASGNTATEDLVYMLNRCGYDTGIDFDRLFEAAKFIRANVDGNYSGHHVSANLQWDSACCVQPATGGMREV